MDKRKLLRVIYVLGVIVVLGLIIFGGIKIYHKIKSKDSKVVPGHVQSKAEIEHAELRTAKFDDILDAYNRGDNILTIKLAMAYGKEGSNGYTERLNAYTMCIQASISIKDNTQKKLCYEAAKAIAKGLEVAVDRTYWLKQIEDTYSGKTTNTGTNDDRSQ